LCALFDHIYKWVFYIRELTTEPTVWWCFCHDQTWYSWAFPHSFSWLHKCITHVFKARLNHWPTSSKSLFHANQPPQIIPQITWTWSGSIVCSS